MYRRRGFRENPKRTPLKPQNLLTQLSDLETSLTNFSFEELSAKEAARLQQSFLTFKKQLERKVWGEGESDPHNGNRLQSSGAAGAMSRADLRSIASASHQMRTPLNAIIGLTDLLKEDKLTSDQHYHLQTIQAASRSLMNMVNELTEFSRLHAGLETFENIPFNIHNLIEDVKYLCNTLIIDQRLNLDVVIDQAIPAYLSSDPSKLTQILLHLLGNTLRTIQDGTITLETQFSHQEGDEIFLEFMIRTERFENRTATASKSRPYNPSINAAIRKTADTGLELPIVKQIIEKLGGELHVQESGTMPLEYVFRLPFLKARKPLAATKGVRTRKSIQSVPSAINGRDTDQPSSHRIDLQAVLEDCMGKIETLEELVALYRKKNLEFIGTVKLHLDRSDFKGISYACNKVTSSLRLFNSQKLVSLVEQMFKNSRTIQDLKHLQFLHACYVAEYPKVEDGITAALEELKRN